MKISKLLISAVLPMLTLTAAAQSDNTPSKGDFTVAATLGHNSYTNVTAMPGDQASYEAVATTSVWNQKKLMVGFEAGYFVNDKWKLDLGGGLNFNHRPGYPDQPGTIDGTVDDTLGEIPGYRAVASQYGCNWNAYAGVDRYFKVPGVANLMWYTGLRVGMAYALNEQKYDEAASMGKSVGETWSLRAGVTMGIDYYVLPAMYVGISVDPFAYAYNMSTYKPQEGLKALEADSHDYSILSAPTLKVGFKF